MVRLDKSAGYTCDSVPGCAQLSAPATAVRPGQLVQFSGRAPLESVIGAHYPFAFQLSATTTRPAGPGVTFVHFAKGGVQMDAGAAEVVVAAAPPFSSLPRTTPLAELVAGATPISATPQDAAYVGWCAPNDVEVQGPAGRSQVPVAGATRLLAATRSYQGQVQDQCDDLALGGVRRPRPPRRARAPPVFAAFTVLPIQGPMVAEVALFTTNAGRSWSFVPTPPGAKRTGFGGFRYQGDDVDALFSPSAPAPDGQAGPPLVEQTADGGRSWSCASLSCPAAGPCVTFGAHVPGNCAQGLDSQGVIASSDNGRHWTEPSWPAGLVTCWPTTLEATSPAQALLVTSNAVLGSESPFDVLVTNDGGRSWQAISLPPLPPAPGDQGGQAAPGPRGQATSPSCPAAACCTSTRRPGSFWPPGPAPGAPSGRWAPGVAQ